jgi:hypothetical protein
VKRALRRDGQRVGSRHRSTSDCRATRRELRASAFSRPVCGIGASPGIARRRSRSCFTNQVPVAEAPHTATDITNRGDRDATVAVRRRALRLQSLASTISAARLLLKRRSGISVARGSQGSLTRDVAGRVGAEPSRSSSRGFRAGRVARPAARHRPSGSRARRGDKDPT